MTKTISNIDSSNQYLTNGPSDRFHPPWIMRNGHVQTLAGVYLFRHKPDRHYEKRTISTTGEVLLADGDRLAFRDDCPVDWKPGDRVALMLHGLAGSHNSPTCDGSVVN